ncbi:sigma-54-dependent transcriptional response regulator [Geotalea daltonii FRC-32]|uniref:Sigma-54-dependent transcriptional response regulator n=1 Tax=Geotalea daltonii (strain DSM 22248 / JCM 15807 / FRC-32) TaxID=316067 RepID=B9M710_GEODF|nr:sigma-54 dependent transcriptional regulator [Geotalea daltonii]ACM22031.1 sigma-54-dependent transcriptional response regulator [Geotalea daltonii FRC-32]
MTVPGKFPILLVDDEEEMLFIHSVMFRGAGFSEVTTLSDSRKVLPLLEERSVALIVLDLYMPFLGGFELLKEIKDRFPQIPVIIMSAANQIELAVECMKTGAFDYFVKPAEKSRLLASVNRALELHSLRDEVSLLTRHFFSDRLDREEVFASIITRNPAMRRIFRYMEAVAASDQPVLVTGETGVGKEMVVRALHDASHRKGQFIAVNVAGLDDQAFSDTLFGHTRGAFTGADQAREGLVTKAAGGTLFLDEIGDLQLPSQIKLLRLLQEREYYPLGSDNAKKSDSRIVVATNRDLKQMMEGNSFRSDLYYRLKTHRIQVPPLRDRLEDMPLLVNHFLDEAAAAMGKSRPVPPVELNGYLAAYSFPGNIRELKGLIFDAVASHQQGVLSLETFRKAIGNDHTPHGPEPVDYFKHCSGAAGERMPTLKEAEEALIAHALKAACGNQGIAAAHLGISRQALNKRLCRRGENPPD